jgi:hypothetical protein
MFHFIQSLFNAAASNCDYRTSSGRVSNELEMSRPNLHVYAFTLKDWGKSRTPQSGYLGLWCVKIAILQGFKINLSEHVEKFLRN